MAFFHDLTEVGESMAASEARALADEGAGDENRVFGQAGDGTETPTSGDEQDPGNPSPEHRDSPDRMGSPSRRGMRRNAGRTVPACAGKPAKANSPDKAPTGMRPASKSQMVLKLLRSSKGASVQAIMEATGWQAHSVRGFLSGTVRKRLCLTLASETGKDGVRRYRIA